MDQKDLHPEQAVHHLRDQHSRVCDALHTFQSVQTQMVFRSGHPSDSLDCAPSLLPPPSCYLGGLQTICHITKDPDFLSSFHLNSDSGFDSDSLSSDKANVLFSSFNDVNDQFQVSLLVG